MIGKNELAEAARSLDAIAEERDFEAVIRGLDLDTSGFVYMAQQRALRVAMLRDGQNPTKLSRTEFTTVRLTPASQAEMLHLTSAWIDGCAVGVRAAQDRRRDA